MKPLSEWSQEEKCIFLSLVTENCWGENLEYNSIIGFWQVKTYLEKNKAKLWEDYLYQVNNGWGKTFSYTKWINDILNLDNLILFLLDNVEEWGWVECERCNGKGYEIRPHMVDRTTTYNYQDTCPTCNGTGKLKHPALVYAARLGVQNG